MDGLCAEINAILGECSRYLSIIKKEKDDRLSSAYKSVFKNFSYGPLLQFVKYIQTFLKIFKGQNLYTLFVCLNQIKKCLGLYEEGISSEDCPNYEKVLIIYLIERIQKCFYKLNDILPMLEKIDEDGQPGFFIDLMNSVLNDLNNRLELQLIKPKIDKIIFQAITIAKVSDETNNLELTASSKYVLKAIKNFEKIDIMEKRDFFHFDYLSSSLSILERRINTTVLHQIYEIFNDPFCTVKKLLPLCISSDHENDFPENMSNYVTDLDKFTDVLIQIGLFAVACCKNSDYVIRLKSCIASLELLECDIIPAFFDFDHSEVKKKMLKLLLNHWSTEIIEIKILLEKIIDPYAFAQITLETSTNIVIAIDKSDSESSIDYNLYKKLLNGFMNFKKYIENIFEFEICKENEFSKTYSQYEKAVKEYSACLTFFQNANDGDNCITKNKLLKRSKLVIKNLKNLQTSIFSAMNDESLPEFENTTYILSKTKRFSDRYIPFENIDNNNFNLLFSTFQTQKSFYNDMEKIQTVTSKDQDIYSSNFNEGTDGNTVIMELTNILDNFIDTLNKNNDHITTMSISEEIIDSPARIQDNEDIQNQLKNTKIY